MPVDPNDILDFWCGPLDGEGLASPTHTARWWQKDAAFDEALRTKFGEAHRAARAGELDSWLETIRGRLAYVILLDQFSRNLYRNQPEMYAADLRAVEAARAGVDRGMDRELPVDMRVFLYMPFMHSEDLDDQERCVALFEALAAGTQGKAEKRARTYLEFARRHRDIVARFGRFPHRNAILGRSSTPEEATFLEAPGSSF